MDPAEKRPDAIGAPDERALRALVSEHMFERPDSAVILSDTSQRIRLTNAALAEMFGYSPDEIRGRTTRMLYADPWGAPRDTAFLNGRAHVRVASTIVQFRRKDGSTFDGEVGGGQIHDAQGTPVGTLEIIRDVSERVATEKVLSHLLRISSNVSLDFEAQLDAILDLGREHFGLATGCIAEVDGDTYTVVHAAGPHLHAAGPYRRQDEGSQPHSLQETFCSHTLWSGNPVGIHHAGASYVSALPFYRRLGIEAYLGAPLVVDGKRYGTVSFLDTTARPPFPPRDLELVHLFAGWIGNEISRRRTLETLSVAQDELQRLATTDPLTGLHNRRELTSRLQMEIQRVRRNGGGLAVAMFDVDHFKHVNDEFGHPVGDRALCFIADTLGETARAVDTISRWGGEEFLALLVDVEKPGALEFAERSRVRVGDSLLTDEGRRITLTLSAGVAHWRPGESPDALIARADAAMYRAKSLGRNRVESGDD